MATPLQNFRADRKLWDVAQEALDAVREPRRVVVTLAPGMNRTTAVVAFLRALVRPTRTATREDQP